MPFPACPFNKNNVTFNKLLVVVASSQTEIKEI